MNKLFISVVVPVYNAEQYIADTLDSIFAQTYKSIETIIVDDGSKDNSLEIINSYRNYPDVKIICKENQGVWEARNNGIAAAEGKYVAFLDADDLWCPEKLAKQVAILNCDLTFHRD